MSMAHRHRHAHCLRIGKKTTRGLPRFSRSENGTVPLRNREVIYRRALTRNARGFTLLEILLATALAAVLLMGLWSLFSIYTSLFETGQTKTETSQLARALLAQLADDLHSAIQDPIPGVPTETRTSTPLRRFVLDGSSSQLRLDVLQVTPLQGNPTPVGDSERMLGEPSAARVPELRTVYYTFQDPLVLSEGEGPSLTDEEGQNLPGLVRRELDFETPPGAEPGSSFGNERAGPGVPASGIPEFSGEPSSSGSITPDVVDTSITWVPEVVRLEFRYFDGSGWSSQWNSLTQKSLPVAVEVVVQLGTVSEPAASDAAVEPPEVEENAELGEELDTGASAEPLGPTYRLVVDIPGSPKHGAPEKVEPMTVRRTPSPPRPAPRRVAPRRLPPPEPAVRPLADEWMRTQP